MADILDLGINLGGTVKKVKTVTQQTMLSHFITVVNRKKCVREGKRHLSRHTLVRGNI